MADKKTKTGPSGPDSKAVLAKMAEKIAKEFDILPPADPIVKIASVEWTAGIMASKGYEMSPRTLEILVDYLKGYNLWLFGNVGVGKTFFFECMNRVRVEERGIEPIHKLSMMETMGWTIDMAREWADENQDFDVLIDDVGTEPEMNIYGIKVELFPYLLDRRMQVYNKRTHITSNLGAEDIIKRYGRRVSDRFVQMFKPERFDSKKSRRTLRPWRESAGGRGLL